METIKVQSQGELDAALERAKSEYLTIIVDSPKGVWLRLSAFGSATVRASGSATVEAFGSATVEASGSATVRASGSATVRAFDSATVEAFGSATVEAFGSATVEASGSATVRASGSATVRAFDSATVEAFGSATVRAFGSATVEAFDSATVEASDSATVEASAYVAVHLFSAYASVEGGVVIDVAALDKTNPKIWCEYTGTHVDVNGLAHLYKAVDDSFNAGHNYKLTNYTPGTVVTAADWEPGNSCGNGLHVCPRPQKAKDHFMEATKFVEVTVPVDEIFPIDWTKVKAQTVTCLREVTIDGDEVSR